jgi:hypothetical protein
MVQVRFSTLSRPALVPTQPPMQRVPGLFPEVKRPVRGIDHHHPSSAEVKERVELYLYSLSARLVVLRTVFLKIHVFWAMLLIVRQVVRDILKNCSSFTLRAQLLVKNGPTENVVLLGDEDSKWQESGESVDVVAMLYKMVGWECSLRC